MTEAAARLVASLTRPPYVRVWRPGFVPSPELERALDALRSDRRPAVEASAAPVSAPRTDRPAPCSGSRLLAAISARDPSIGLSARMQALR